MVALRSFEAPAPRKPAWMSEPEIVREEREYERDLRHQEFEDADNDRRYAFGDGGDE